MFLTIRVPFLALWAAAGLVACGGDSAPSAPVAVEPTEMAGEMAGETAAQPTSQEPAVDPISGLIIDEGWEVVRGTCAACHSASLVTQNRGSRETWEGMIRWMQETQGLWPLDPGMEATILDYLAKNYAPEASSRRAPLPPGQMPPNPYDPGPS